MTAKLDTRKKEARAEFDKWLGALKPAEVLAPDDGLTLAALYRPPDAGKRVLVFFHGNGDGWDGAALANRMLVDAGYGALLAEYRGYGANPGQPGEAGFYADGWGAIRMLRYFEV